MTAWPERVGILGAGALGTLFAHGLASHTSAEVWLFTRAVHPGRVAVEGAGSAAVRVHAAGQGSADGAAPGPVVPGSGPAVGPARPVDLALVLVKAYATGEAVDLAIRHGFIGEQSVALTLQNGLGNAEALAHRLGPGRVLAGATAQGATLLAPGRVRHGGRGLTEFAPVGSGPAPSRAEAVAALLGQAGMAAAVAPDYRPLLWSKLAINCGINALTALLRLPNGELVDRPEAVRLMQAAAREAVLVAAAEGVALPGETLLEETAQRVLAVARATAANRSSMLQDVERGRRTEIDAINGAVAERGRALGVSTPVNAVLADLVRALGPAAAVAPSA